jgi:beta-glucosidase
MRQGIIRTLMACSAALLLSANCDNAREANGADAALAGPPADPALWPKIRRPPLDPAIEKRIDDLLAKMTLEEKVGQTVQAEIQSVTPEDVRTYHLGSILSGGGSTPGGNRRAARTDWVVLADKYWAASMDTSDGGVAIPVMWGIDAVHGDSNVFGATVFPHNVGLGAAHDPDLVKRIGEVVAREVSSTGLDWTFSPTVAVPLDDRWGRAYEGFSEDPKLVASYARAFVEGVQGVEGSEGFLGDGRIVATVKHFLGDGGTLDGRDQGETRPSETELRDIHGAGYFAAIEAGVQTVMASFSSWGGEKLHGRGDLLTGVLKERMGFDGFVVGDWNGHGQVTGCTNDNCPKSYNAGVDMIMVPQDWRALYTNTLEQAKTGVIPPGRLDEAVRRILRVKLRAGLFEEVRPSERAYAKRQDVLGSPEHRAVAREAVRKSLVLLKNQGKLLPLAPSQRILVAGDAADDIGRQAGGWTLSWQGNDNTNDDFPNGASIWDAVSAAVTAAGGKPVLSLDGAYDAKPDVAIVVFGETPYAEFQGDRSTVAFSPSDRKHVALLRRLRESGVPTVSIFLTGRPLWVNEEINASSAFVVAWLPGSQGAGVTDVLFRATDGSTPYDFTGRLSFSWPADATQAVLNAHDPNAKPLFKLGYGLSYADNGDLAALSEDPGLDLSAADARTVFMVAGAPLRPWRIALEEAGGESVTAETDTASSKRGWLALQPASWGANEPASALTWSGAGEASAAITAFQPNDLSRESNGAMALVASIRLDRKPGKPVRLGIGGDSGSGSTNLSAQLANAAPGQTTLVRVRLSCLAAAGAPVDKLNRAFSLTASEPLRIEIADIRLAEGAPTDRCDP